MLEVYHMVEVTPVLEPAQPQQEERRPSKEQL